MPDTADRSKLRSIAKYQRAVILSLLANIIMVVIGILVRTGVIHFPPTMAAAFGVIALVITLFIMGSVFMLAKEFTNVFLAGLVALLMLIPFISLILLLVYNQKATAYLQQHGIKVGFFGVSSNAIG